MPAKAAWVSRRRASWVSWPARRRCVTVMPRGPEVESLFSFLRYVIISSMF